MFPSGPLTGEKGEIQNGKGERLGRLHKLLQNLSMYFRVAHHALLAHAILARLKLRLDEAEYLAAIGLEQRPDGREHQLEGNKRNIHHREIQRLAQLLGGDIADVGALHGHHPGIVADFPGQLAIAHINGKDLPGALLQQAVVKPPVEAPESLQT